MPKIEYKYINFKQPTLDKIEQANEIIREYAGQGYDLTLRQLYYQMVARDLIPNTPREYKNLGTTITNARNAGLIDWSAIVDRTRGRESLSAWDNPGDILKTVAKQFRIGMWKNQVHRPMVWVEKEALAGVIERACFNLDIRVPFLSCRGYMSASAIWIEGMIIRNSFRKIPVVIHLADHDPSGIDMTKDNRKRLELYSSLVEGHDFHYIRIALNMDQVERYNPPPNPAKITDSRYEDYAYHYGTDSWELDALEPSVITDLIRDKVNEYKNTDQWEADLKQENEYREVLDNIAENWGDLEI